MNKFKLTVLIALLIGLVIGFTGGYGLNSYQAFDGGGGGGGNGGYGTGTPEELFADAMAVELAKVIYEANPENGGPQGMLNNFLGKASAQSNELPTEKEINCYSANSESIGRAIMAAVDSRVDGLDIPAGSSTQGNGCWLMHVKGYISGEVIRYVHGTETPSLYNDRWTVVKLTFASNTEVQLQYYDRDCRLIPADLSVPAQGVTYQIGFYEGRAVSILRGEDINSLPPPWKNYEIDSICKFKIPLDRTIGSLDPSRCPNCQTSGGGGGINTNE